MIVWLARGLTRLVALVLLPLLAVVALAAAAAALAGGALAEDAARSLGLTAASRAVGDALGGGSIDAQSVLLGGVIALAAGLILLVGVLVPRKERDIPLASDAQLGVRRRALRQALRHRAESARGVRDARVRLRIGRLRPGGRVSVRAVGPARSDQQAMAAGVTERIDPLAGAFGLRARVHTSSADDRKEALR